MDILILFQVPILTAASVAASPLDHLRVVQVDLHEVLLLGVVAIKRPAGDTHTQVIDQHF